MTIIAAIEDQSPGSSGNDYFTKPAELAPQTKARSVDINTLGQAVNSAFDKLPTELVLKRGTVNYAEDTGAVNAIAVSVNPTVITALADGMEVRVKVKFANTTAAPTLNLNGLGAVVIARADGSAIQPSDIPANIVTFSYNATTAKWVFTPPGAKGEKGDQGIPGNNDVLRKARSSNTAITVADAGDLIDITSGTFTQTFDAAAVLGNGWHVWIRNSGTGDITLDPSGTETIDGLASFIMYPGEARLIQCDGTALRSIVINSFKKTYSASGTFVMPPGYDTIRTDVIGGGAGGATGASGYGGGGGGGGSHCIFPVSGVAAGTSITVTVGAGGAGATVAGTSGAAGGNSSFGSYVTAYGGKGNANYYAGGAGGGAMVDHQGEYGYAYGYGYGSSTSSQGGNSEWGGAGGGHANSSGNAGAGGSSVFATGGGGAGGYSGWAAGAGGAGGGWNAGGGGAAGAAAGGAGTAGAAGTNGKCGSGGGGGNGNAATGGAGGAGGFPGGGGGGGGLGTSASGVGGNGGAGQVTVWGVA